ncbi:MAG TPA: excinuclease ABC subunit UvrA [bacterium]|nr:excinuclease ABC subunit UvrA [bacterium]HOG38408.1 excinuclease ABC subunit UvrA [bacterium]
MIDNQKIVIRGARVHNLKNINIDFPRNKFIVISGLSGSGKSSLAFDTLFAEAQRRYMESLSTYSRQFMGLLDKPDVDRIDGLPPAISIDQGIHNRSPRSTVGTVTEIYDYLRLIFSRIGKVHCINCGSIIEKQELKQIVKRIREDFKDKKVYILSPITKNKKPNLNIISKIKRSGYDLVRVDGEVLSITDTVNKRIADDSVVDIVIEKIDLLKDKNLNNTLNTNVSTALDLSNGFVIVKDTQLDNEKIYSNQLYCYKCNKNFPILESKDFSFNSPSGACMNCGGLGIEMKIDPELLIPNNRLSLSEGALRLLYKISVNQNVYYKILNKISAKNDIDLNIPVKNLPQEKINIILYGKDDEAGVVQYLEKKYLETDSDYVKSEIEKCMRSHICEKCNGKRLKKEALSVKVLDKDISEFSSLTVKDFKKLFDEIIKFKKLNSRDLQIAEGAIREILKRTSSILDLGLGYLSLDRTSISLSGGEAQRLRLATQINSSLSGILYILDEPSIGLHQKDNYRLIKILKDLKMLGNTIVVIEHDKDTILSSDFVVDIGPGAGENGGHIVAYGTPEEIKKNKKSITGKYLSGGSKIDLPKSYRNGNGKFLEILGASEFNLKDIDVKIPLGMLVCFTGVSGSGKSTLVFEILGKALSSKLTRSKDIPGRHKTIKGLENIDKVINIDQSSIGRTPRSNPATYTGVFTYIRDLFAGLPESKLMGYKLGKFSFNVKGGRCEACQGNGLIKIEMNFMPDIYVECEECDGKRYGKEILDIHYKDANISDVLNMSVSEAMKFFSDKPIIFNKLKTLNDVGLGYIKLGQSATTLSGGEAQRVKLATELSRKATGKTLYILDEPTTGLHFEDVKKLIDILQKLVDKGNSVLIIEHNLEVIKCADWIIDLGPEGGDEGGEIVACGTPKELSKSKISYTGKYLKNLL